MRVAYGSGGVEAGGRELLRGLERREAESAKVAFVDLWNSTIATQYGVKSFSSDAI